MERKQRAGQSNVAYEEFDPVTKWEQEATFDTLIVHLPGFKKEELKVQVTSSNKLRITGETPLGSNKRKRFSKELPIPENCVGYEISAKFEGGKLYIKHPKIITPADHQPQPKAEAPKPASGYPPSAGQEQASQAAEPAKSTSMVKQPSKKASGVGSASADSSEKKSAEDLAEEGKTTAGTVEKDKKLDAAASKAEREAAESSNGSRDKFRVEEMKQALGGLVTHMKQQRKFLNMIVTGLLVLVAWIYARNAIGSAGKSKN